MIRIGLDAMGGDFAPEVAVKGAVMALDELGTNARIVLFGNKARIDEILASEVYPVDVIEVVTTSEEIEMGDHPVRAFQQKTDSSIVVGFRHLAEGKIDGFASAGSTGAIMVGSTQLIKVVEGVIRPTIAVLIGRKLLLDVGLNVDCRPDVLEQYAMIGSIFAESTLGIESPRVALLNIGTEDSKGNLQTKAAYELMQVGSEAGKYDFIGNIEASHLFSTNEADVIVCDGFVGNMVLKLAEGLYSINAAAGMTNGFWEQMNYENIGGTPVLGVNAPVIIGHGKSTAKAIKNMILATKRTIESGMVENLKKAFINK